MQLYCSLDRLTLSKHVHFFQGLQDDIGIFQRAQLDRQPIHDVAYNAPHLIAYLVPVRCFQLLHELVTHKTSKRRKGQFAPTTGRTSKLLLIVVPGAILARKTGIPDRHSTVTYFSHGVGADESL